MKNARNTAAAALLGALVALLPLTASAGQYTSSWKTITQLESHGNGIRVYGLNLSPNPAGCSNTGSADVGHSLAGAKREGLRRALIAAFLSGRKVKVKLDSTACSTGDRPILYGVWTK